MLCLKVYQLNVYNTIAIITDLGSSELVLLA